MPKNHPLGHINEMDALIKKLPIKISFKKLKKLKHKVFTELHELSGDEYQKKLAELK